MRPALAALIALVIGATHPAQADAGAPNHCSVSVTPVAFGNYHPLAGGDARTTGILTYNCTASRPITISLSRGGSSHAMDRELKFKGARVRYNLYLDAAATIAWGDGTDGTQVYRDQAPPVNTNVSVPIYSQMPRGQRETVGVYNDTLVVQLSY